MNRISKRKNISGSGYIYAGITAIIWSIQAILIKVSLGILHPVSVTCFRFIVAFSVMMIYLLISDRSFLKLAKRPPWILFFAAIFLGLNYLGFISGVNETTPSNAQIFIQVGPVGLALAGIFIFKEKVRWKHLLGFSLLIIGFYLFYNEQVEQQSGSKGDYSTGVLYVVASGISWTLFSILQKILVRNHEPLHLNLFIFGICTLLFLPFFEFSRLSFLSLKEWFILSSIGFMTIIAYGSFAYALKYAEANKVSVILTMNPVLTFIGMAILEVAAVSWIEFEKLTFLSIAGSVLVLGGALLVIISGGKE